MKKQIIYHSNCTDGFCAAWLCSLVWPEAEFTPINYGWDTPDVTDKDVLIVDFSPDRHILLEMAAKASKIHVLDHHKTGQDKLEGLPYCTFDMTRSGARLAWDYLISEKLLNPWTLWDGFSSNVHWLVEYIEDYDLFNRSLPNHDEICAAIRSYEPTFDNYNQLALLTPDDLLIEGRAILRYQDTLVAHHIKYAQRLTINNINCVGVYCSMNKLGSKICHELLQKFTRYPVAAVWQDTTDGTRLYSLRARKNDFNVRVLAESLGGGGHDSAAGIKVEYHMDLKGPVTHYAAALSEDVL